MQKQVMTYRGILERGGQKAKGQNFKKPTA